MTHARLSDVIDEFDFNGTISRTQIEHAVPVADSVDRGADVDALIDEAIDAGVLEVKYDREDLVESENMAVPDRPSTFVVVES